MSARRPLRRAVLLLVGVSALNGCQTTRPTNQQAAEERWSMTRADVKARLAADQLAAGNVEAAAAALGEAERLDQTPRQHVALQARICLAQGDVAAAEQVLASVPATQASAGEIAYLRGIVNEQKQQWTAATAAYDQALAAQPGEVAYLVAAVQARLQQGATAEARSLLKQHEATLGWTNAYSAVLAECAEQGDDWATAASAWQRVCSATPENDDLRLRQATAWFRAERYDEATTLLTDLAEHGDEATRQRARLLLAECALAHGQPATARDLLKQVLRHDAKSAPTLRMLARALWMLNDQRGALSVARQALAASPQDVESLALVTVLARRVGDTRLADQTFAELTRRAPNDPLVKQLQQRLGA